VLLKVEGISDITLFDWQLVTDVWKEGIAFNSWV
jgi:hypothetical protein